MSARSWVRTVKPDASVRIEGETWRATGPHGQELMTKWVGERVQVQDHNFWGTEKYARRERSADTLRTVSLRADKPERTIIEDPNHDEAANAD